VATNSRFAVAVHIMAVLASKKERFVPSRSIASSVNTNPVVIRRILSDLTRARIVDSEHGKTGGSRLAKGTGDVTLWDICRAVGEDKLFAVHQNPRNESCPISCRIKNILGSAFGKAEQAAELVFRRVTLKKLVGEIA
jgi:Rrf2 family protein